MLAMVVEDGDITWLYGAMGFQDPMTTRGDIIYRNSSNETVRLALGGGGTFLKSDGADLVYGAGGAGGGGLSWVVISSNTNAATDTGYLINASGGNITLTLPAAPNSGDTIGVCDIYNQATTNVITIGRNGLNIEGDASDLIINLDGAGLTIVYSDATRGWEIVSEIGSGAGDALTSNSLSQFAATTSLQLKGIISDETGNGALVFADSPALVTPTGIVKGDVGLGNVDNTSDVNKPVSTSTSTEIDGDITTHNALEIGVHGKASPITHSPAPAATATLNLTNGKIHDITMPAGNIVIAVSNEINGQIFTIRVVQDGTGSRTVTWFTTIKWAGGSAPTLTTTGNKADTFIFRVTGTDTYDGFIVGQDI